MWSKKKTTQTAGENKGASHVGGGANEAFQQLLLRLRNLGHVICQTDFF